MLISREVEVSLVSPVIKHYEDLGYKIPRVLNRDKVMTVPRGSKIIVNVDDLPKSSDMKVTVQCDYCGELIEKQYKKYLKGKENEFCDKDACGKCSKLKQEDVLIAKYGVSTAFEIKGVRDKASKNRRKYNIDIIKQKFDERGYGLISEIYINTDEKLNYVCSKHKEKGIQGITLANFLSGQGCWHCGNEKISEALKFNYDYVKQIFENRNCTIISKEYINCKLPIEFKCNEHNDIIQSSTLDNFNVVGCIYCNKENKRMEQTLSKNIETYTYLRNFLQDWKRSSMESSNYKCVITGQDFDDIHHLYSFRNIMDEALNDLKLDFYKHITEYKTEDINKIIFLLQQKHKNYGDGVCLKREIHELFHKSYGFQNNTKEQFESFKLKYQNNEYDIKI